VASGEQDRIAHRRRPEGRLSAPSRTRSRCSARATSASTRSRGTT
jgi:hypothetical protein